MRRIIVAFVLTFAFATGLLAGFTSHPAAARNQPICYLYPCDPEWNDHVVCCRSASGVVTCWVESCGD